MNDLLNILLDDNNKEPISLIDEDGKVINFDQVAVIPYGAGKKRKLYAILKPIDKVDGIADDEGVVFNVNVNDQGETYLVAENDEETAIQIFNKFYDLLEKSLEQKKE